MVIVKTGFPGDRVSDLSRSYRGNAAVRKQGYAIILERGNKMFKTSSMKTTVPEQVSHYGLEQGYPVSSADESSSKKGRSTGVETKSSRNFSSNTTVMSLM